MKIVDFKATPVAVPMEAPLRHSAAVHPGRCVRTILQVYTDDGIVGIGDLEDLRVQVIGAGHLLLQGQYLSRNRIYAGLEIALLDIQGKAIGRPLYQLLGGRVRQRIPMSAYLFYRYAKGDHPEVSTPDEMVAHARDLV